MTVIAATRQPRALACAALLANTFGVPRDALNESIDAAILATTTDVVSQALVGWCEILMVDSSSG